MLASAAVAFAQAGPELLNACIQALKQHPQPPRNRPAYTTGRTTAAMQQQYGDDFVEVTGPAQLQTLLTGRGPTQGGAESNEEPLRVILAQWARDKGLTFDDPRMTYERFGFLAARKMHQSGSELFRLHQPSGLFDQVLTPERLDLLKAQIAAGEMTAITSTLRGVLTS